MSFISLSYLTFFPLVVLVYFCLPFRWRYLWLLTASSYFYVRFIPIFLLILIFTIVVDYTAGILMETHRHRKRTWLTLSLGANLGVLFMFKYFNFVDAEVSSLCHFLGWNYSGSTLRLILPLGLSFHTFQAMSYVFEVYHGRQKAERHLGYYALYVLFFPQLVAGPIERPQNLLPQFRRTHTFNSALCISGLRLILLGVFKKVVVANRMAPLVDWVYGNSRVQPGLNLIVGTVFFAVQIYADFSAYTDIARGSARILGIDLMENFKAPYLSRSVTEFWQRWHISLSSWFRDYVYIPLGGNRNGPIATLRNMFVVFFLSGFWHGANWTFLIWGLWNFCLIGVEHLFPAFRDTQNRMTTFVFVMLGWVFFRSSSISNAFSILEEMLYTRAWQWVAVFRFDNFKINCLLIVLFLVGEWLWFERDGSLRFFLSPRWLRWTSYYFLLFLIFWLGQFDHSRFIYFQF